MICPKDSFIERAEVSHVIVECSVINHHFISSSRSSWNLELFLIVMEP